MSNLKKFVKYLTNQFAKLIVKIFTASFLGRYILDQIVGHLRSGVTSVCYKNIKLQFSTQSSLCHYRATTFDCKEPETLNWIDSIPYGAVFWDVGANVGLYSCYAAKSRGCKVFSFEPSVFNLEILARNIFINDLTDSIYTIPLPLSGGLVFSKLKMTSLDLGGALSTFNENYGQDGKLLNDVFSYSTVGLSVDEAVNLLKIPSPSYMKIDVDGIESLILSGANEVLKNVKGVLIEINEDFLDQFTQSKKILQSAGFVLKCKSNTDQESALSNSYNQIWVRTD